jgi:hypothetical protein
MPTLSIIPNFSSLPLYLVTTGLRTIQFLFCGGFAPCLIILQNQLKNIIASWNSDLLQNLRVLLFNISPCTMSYFGMLVKLKELIIPSHDCQRHGRGKYFFFFQNHLNLLNEFSQVSVPILPLTIAYKKKNYPF